LKTLGLDPQKAPDVQTALAGALVRHLAAGKSDKASILAAAKSVLGEGQEKLGEQIFAESCLATVMSKHMHGEKTDVAEVRADMVALGADPAAADAVIARATKGASTRRYSGAQGNEDAPAASTKPAVSEERPPKTMPPLEPEVQAAIANVDKLNGPDGNELLATPRRKLAIEELMHVRESDPRAYQDLAVHLAAASPEEQAVLLGMLASRREAASARDASAIGLASVGIDYAPPKALRPVAIGVVNGESVPVFGVKNKTKDGACEILVADENGKKRWVPGNEREVRAIDSRTAPVAYDENGSKRSGYGVGIAGEDAIVFDRASRTYRVMKASDAHPAQYGVSAVDAFATVGKRYDAKREQLEPKVRTQLDSMIDACPSATHQMLLARVFALHGSVAECAQFLELVRVAFPPRGECSPQDLVRLCTADGVVQYYNDSCVMTSTQYQRALASPLEALKLVALGREGILAEQKAGLAELSAQQLPRAGAAVLQVPGKGAGGVLVNPPSAQTERSRIRGAGGDQAADLANRRLAPALDGEVNYRAVEGAAPAVVDGMFELMAPPNEPPPEGVQVHMSRPNGDHAVVLVEVEPRLGKDQKPSVDDSVFVLRDPEGGEIRITGRELKNGSPVSGLPLGLVLRGDSATAARFGESSLGAIAGTKGDEAAAHSAFGNDEAMANEMAKQRDAAKGQGEAGKDRLAFFDNVLQIRDRGTAREVFDAWVKGDEKVRAAIEKHVMTPDFGGADPTPAARAELWQDVGKASGRSVDLAQATKIFGDPQAAARYAEALGKATAAGDQEALKQIASAPDPETATMLLGAYEQMTSEQRAQLAQQLGEAMKTPAKDRDLAVSKVASDMVLGFDLHGEPIFGPKYPGVEPQYRDKDGAFRWRDGTKVELSKPRTGGAPYEFNDHVTSYSTDPDSDVATMKITHGTAAKHEPSVRKGPRNVGEGLFGNGLYLAVEGDTTSAARFGGLVYENLKTKGLLGPDDPKGTIVMNGSLNKERPLKVGTFMVVPDEMVDIPNGRLPAKFADDPALMKQLQSQFDMIDLRVAPNFTAFGLPRMLIVYERAGADAVVWGKTEPGREPSGAALGPPDGATPPPVMPVLTQTAEAGGRREAEQKPNYNECVANVCAAVLNAGGGEANTAASVQARNGLVTPQRDGNNANTATVGRSIAYIEKATGLRGVPVLDQGSSPGSFLLARRPGHYAMFFNEQHVVHAEVHADGTYTIDDGNVGRTWQSYDAFIAYARSLPSLYGALPGTNEQRQYRCYWLRPDAPEPLLSKPLER
jgi:hypothetical protein